MHGGLPISLLNSSKWDRDEELHTGPLRINWQKKSSVFKFSADEEGKNSLQHLVYITALCLSRGCVYSEALWCITRRVLRLLFLGNSHLRVCLAAISVSSLWPLTNPISAVEQSGGVPSLLGLRCLSTAFRVL